ncbi:Coq4 family protein [Lusitaniella coriacea]|uniref:Coq4 family protein n=1 Tax=Lusitaniella coriacea TaxID=1983105 RepID=UPI003CF50086
MATVRRFIKAIKDYYQKGETGDIAYLKIELLRIGSNTDLLAQLQDIADYYPTIDLEELSQLPEGTLGYEYAQHMKRNNIHPLVISSDLIEAAKANPFALRFTATHDIFHILLGFDTTYAGEVGVLGFMIGQGYSKFLQAYEPVVKHFYPFILRSQAQQIRANLDRGKALGEQAKCLLAYRFEDNWSRPIEDIRAELRLVLKSQQFDAESGNTSDRSPEIVTA